MSGIEQRRYPRIEVNWPAAAIDESGTRIDGFVIDASQGGVAFVSNTPCTSGRNFQVQLRMPSQFPTKHEICAIYKCVYIQAAGTKKAAYKSGLQLIDIAPEDLEALISALFEAGKNNFSV